MKQAGQFTLQLDEMTDVSGEAQLLAFVRYEAVLEAGGLLIILVYFLFSILNLSLKEQKCRRIIKIQDTISVKCLCTN